MIRWSASRFTIAPCHQDTIGTVPVADSSPNLPSHPANRRENRESEAGSSTRVKRMLSAVQEQAICQTAKKLAVCFRTGFASFYLQKCFSSFLPTPQGCARRVWLAAEAGHGAEMKTIQVQCSTRLVWSLTSSLHSVPPAGRAQR